MNIKIIFNHNMCQSSHELFNSYNYNFKSNNNYETFNSCNIHYCKFNPLPVNEMCLEDWYINECIDTTGNCDNINK